MIACFENQQFCDDWHIDGFSQDYFGPWKDKANGREGKMLGLEIIGALEVLLSIGSFTALQFR